MNTLLISSLDNLTCLVQVFFLGGEAQDGRQDFAALFAYFGDCPVIWMIVRLFG